MNISHEELQVFLGLARHLNFKLTAEDLRLPHSSVSKYLAQLEEKLGVKLLHRTTRKVTLSEEGERFLPLAQAWQSQMGEMLHFFEDRQKPQGPLRITAPHSLGQAIMGPLLVAFHQIYPDIQIELILSDSVLDLVEERIDLAVRIMSLQNSSLMAKKLMDNPVVACAAPSYLRQSPTIKRIKDLQKHPVFALEIHHGLLFKKSGIKLKDLLNTPWLSCQSGEFINRLGLLGQGIIIRSRWHVEEYLQKGELKLIELNDSLESKSQIYAVYPSRKYLPARTRVLIDFLAERCAKAYDLG